MARNERNVQVEDLGPAETILQTLLQYSDHLYHNRPGMVVTDASSAIGVRWLPVTHKKEDGKKIIYELRKAGKKTVRVPRGELADDLSIKEGRRKVGQYRPAGIFPEVAVWLYARVAEVWQMDNEFAARWASYAFRQEHRDIKVVLAAFMLVQARRGDPVPVGPGEAALFDEDHRDVGEAMILIRDGKTDFNPKMLLRVRELLLLPPIAKFNLELGFGRSAKNPFLGRWEKAVTKWLKYREQNPKMLEGLVKAAFRNTTMELARAVGYRPESPKFFEVLRWKQKQAAQGHRTLAIGQAVKAAESWAGLTERQICERILADKPDYKRIVGLLPSKMGLTRAIMTAAIEAGGLSDKDVIIQTPTLEELGLLKVQEVKERLDLAVQRAEDQRARNIASRVSSKELKTKLEEAADTALKAAVEEVAKDIRIYVIIDISASMTGSIEEAKQYLGQFLQAFPLDRLHVAVFNTAGREVSIKTPTAAGVNQAFRGIKAGGGTNHSAGVRALQKHRPKPDEDVLFIFVGDEAQPGTATAAIQASGLSPMAFGLVKVADPGWGGSFVTDTAAQLGIPCFAIDKGVFADAYAIPRTIRALVAATPVGEVNAGRHVARKSLVEVILETELLQKPAWAA